MKKKKSSPIYSRLCLHFVGVVKFLSRRSNFDQSAFPFKIKSSHLELWLLTFILLLIVHFKFTVGNVSIIFSSHSNFDLKKTSTLRKSVMIILFSSLKEHSDHSIFALSS